MSLREEALAYHRRGRKGKIEVRFTKPTATQNDLSLAYSPGVAEPCREIAENPDLVFEYTARGNLVAVISDGTAVLGLGDIGPVASKPVMEGKGVLFKRFADIDVFDLEVDSGGSVDEFCRVVRALEPGLGGVNLEDIKAPECYEIEERLKKEMGIPVFHDDQHGTAIISSAALVNALELIEKDIGEVSIVINGAGASAISCARMFVAFGADKKRIIMLDSKGVLYEGREEGLNRYKEEFLARTEKRTLREAMEGADVFVGLSVGGVVDADMVRSMARDPIVFAMANPDPEIPYPEAKAARPDVIAGTGRSDYPNQINNVLGFPFIFRGALDVQASDINEEMKMAAARALAQLAKEDVPESVVEAYGVRSFYFGREYLIPKPLDPRALVRVSAAVAEAAMKTGVARRPVDLDEYRVRLENLLGRKSKIMRDVVRRVRRGKPCRIVFPEGEEEVILHACHQILMEGVGKPVLLGNPKKIRRIISELHYNLREDDLEIIDPDKDPRRADYAEKLYRLRRYKGMTRKDCHKRIREPITFGMMMVENEDAECLLAGVTHSYAETLRPALQIIRVQDWVHRVAGLYIISVGERAYLFADTTVNIDPTATQLAEIAISAAVAARQFGLNPRVAMLSFSNAGASEHPRVQKVRDALRIARERFPDLVIDGEMQLDVAIDPKARSRHFPDSVLKSWANVLVFPDLDSANIAYKLMMTLGQAEGIGPLIVGLRRPVNVIAQGSDAEAILNIAAITVAKAQAEGEQV